MQNFRKEVRSIAIIDDDYDDYELVLEAVKEINPEISVAYISNCEEAVKYKNEHFDLVLLDINMPQHDGFHWLKSIRKRSHDLPVIMYTNSLSPAHIAKAYDEGASLYFSKPDRFTLLIEGLSRLIQLDWTNPLSITSQYRQQGYYKTFSV